MDSPTILITGATSGIGKAAALALAQRGSRVIASGRNEALLAALATESGGRIQTVVLDVNDQNSITSAAARVSAMTGGHGVDVLINNAGYGQFGPALEVSDQQLRDQFNTNIFGLMGVSRAFAGKMIERRSGRIINISSGGGKMSFPFAGAYTATKYALESLSDAMRMELRPFGVKVVLIEPGPINTNFSGTVVATIGSTDRPESPWASLYSRTRTMQSQIDAFSFHPRTVVRAIEKAVFRSSPAARYTAPSFLKISLWMNAFVPTAVMDWLMCRAMGLTKIVPLADNQRRKS